MSTTSSPTTAVPSPTSVGSVPRWAPIAGAAFGALTLLALIAVVYLASQQAMFVCNAFTPLAMLFAFGGALAAGFIGGAAAFQGQLGQKVQENAFIFTAGGGVAVLAGMFVIFNMFKQPNCDLSKRVDSLNTEVARLNSELQKAENTYNEKLTAQKAASDLQLGGQKKTSEAALRSAKDDSAALIEKERSHSQKQLDQANAASRQKIDYLTAQLAQYQKRDMRITPEAYNQPRLLADKLQVHYFNRQRADVFLPPTQGSFVIKMQDIDEGSTISIAPRPSSEVARPGSGVGGAEDSEASVQLSSFKYLSTPNYFELQLYLNIGGKQ